MNKYYYSVYEDRYAVYLCVFKENKIRDDCVCIERIGFDAGRNEDGTFSELCEILQNDPEFWEQWSHSEDVPSLMFNRDLVFNAKQIALAMDLSEWKYFYDKMSVEAAIILGIYGDDDECEECRLSGLIEED